MKIGLAIVVAAVIGLLGGYLIGSHTARPPEDLYATLAEIQADLAELKKAQPAPAPARRPSGPDPEKVYDVKLGGSPVKGAADAKVTIVEFSDFQCPFCDRVGPTLARLLEEYPDDVRIVYKHLPLSFHKDALPAAKASTAAGRQGKFWEMHDQLFASQRDLSEERFVEIAKNLGLDVGRFEADYRSAAVAIEVAQDMNEARRLGVTGTPGFFVNGRFSSGAKSYDSFKVMVDAALKQRG
jgi:protein-disulfide isomerase